MWWNVVARSCDEVDAAYTSWAHGNDRFGRVRSALIRIAASASYWH